MSKCKNCNKEYELFMFYNYNLDLCKECYNEAEKENFIQIDETIDKVKHTVACPKCGAKYGSEIADEKCKTEGCPVHFFWMHDDGYIFARWIE